MPKFWGTQDADNLGNLIGNIISPFLFPAIQWNDFKKWESEKRETYNGWRSVGWGFLGTIIYFVLSFIVIVSMDII